MISRVLFILSLVALLPFSTSLMVTHLDASGVRFGVLVYGVNVLLASLTLSFLIFYVAREPGLVVGNMDDARLKQLFRRRWSVIGVNVLALAIGLVEPRVAVGLYLIMTVMLMVLPFLGLRRHRRQVQHGGEILEVIPKNDEVGYSGLFLSLCW